VEDLHFSNVFFVIDVMFLREFEDDFSGFESLELFTTDIIEGTEVFSVDFNFVTIESGSERCFFIVEFQNIVCNSLGSSSGEFDGRLKFSFFTIFRPVILGSPIPLKIFFYLGIIFDECSGLQFMLFEVFRNNQYLNSISELIQAVQISITESPIIISIVHGETILDDHDRVNGNSNSFFNGRNGLTTGSGGDVFIGTE